MEKGSSLKSLVEEHGFGIVVQPAETSFTPIIVIEAGSAGHFKCRLVRTGAIVEMKEHCDTTDDYVFVEKLPNAA